MKCIIRLGRVYYGGQRGQPRWVPTLAEARVFPSVKLARGVVKVLRDRRIKAEVMKLTGGAVCQQKG